MTKTIDALVEALEQSTELLVRIVEGKEWGAIEEYIDEARAALAQARAEQAEPVYQYQLANESWIDQTKTSHDYNVKHEQAAVRVLYTTPPAAQVAKLEPMSREEIFDLAEPFGAFEYGDAQGDKRIDFARAIEAAHSEKLFK